MKLITWGNKVGIAAVAPTQPLAPESFPAPREATSAVIQLSGTGVSAAASNSTRCARS